MGTTQVALTHFMLKCNMDPSSNNDQHLMVNKEKEGDDEMISCWSGNDGNWIFDEVGRDFLNKGEDLYNITKAMHVLKPLKKDRRKVASLEEERRQNSSCLL